MNLNGSEKKSKKNFFNIFMIIYLSSSFVGISMNGTINLLLIIVLVLINLFLLKFYITITKKESLLILFLLSSSIVTIIINNDGIYNYLIFYIVLIGAFILAKIIEFDTFIYIYAMIINFLSIFSLITFVLLVFVPSLLEIFPDFTNSSGLTLNNHFFSVTYYSSYFNSNYGLFWEPGAYQTFLNIGLFFELFLIKNTNLKRILILFITILTTFSTTGYIGMLLVFSIYSLSLGKINKKNIKIIIYLIISIFFGGILIKTLPNNIIFSLFGKLEILFNPSIDQTNITYGSTTVRVNSIKTVLYSFIQNPIFGVGFSNLSKASYFYGSQGMLTATPLNWFGLFGLSTGLIFNYGLWVWTRYTRENFLIRILIFLFLIVIFITENYVRNLFFLFFIFIGLFGNNLSRKETK